MMSDTPRTDASSWCAGSYKKQTNVGYIKTKLMIVSAEVSAQLERELAAVTSERDAALRKLEERQAIIDQQKDIIAALKNNLREWELTEKEALRGSLDDLYK